MIRIPKELVVGIVKQSKVDPTVTPSADIVPNEKERHAKLKRLTSQTRTVRKYDNQPLPGYTILTNEGGWYGSKTVWTVVDPRGFKTNISSSNITSIFGCGSISKGLIQDRCVWGYDSGEMILIPESSDVYIDAQENTELLDSKVNIRTVELGSKVTLKSKVEAYYLGSYFAFMEKDNWDSSTRNKTYTCSSKKRLFFAKKDKTGAITIFSETTNKISKAEDVNPTYSDKDANLALINNAVASKMLMCSVTNQQGTGYRDSEVLHVYETKKVVTSLSIVDEIDDGICYEIWVNANKGVFYIFDKSTYSSSHGMTICKDDPTKIVLTRDWQRAQYEQMNCVKKYISIKVG